MRRYLLILLGLSIHSTLNAADNYLLGARAAGLSNAAVTLDDVWSSSHNQAGLGLLEHPSASAYFENRFLVSELALKAFAFALPVNGSGTFAISASQFGYSKYNENKAGIAYGRKLGNKVTGGIQLDYLSTVIGNEYGKASAVAVEGGILAEPLEDLRIGIHVFNPTRARLADYDDERIPVLLRAGASYRFSKLVILCAEVEKDLDYASIFRAGIEYHPAEQLYLRGGISTNPAQGSFGFGLKLEHFTFDIASSYHEVLGLSPQAGLTYDFSKP